MNAQDARQYILSQGLKVEAVATPFWPQLDGSVLLQDIPSDNLVALESLKKAPNGDGLYLGAVLCKALVVRDSDTGALAQLFQDTDREVVAGLGSGMLNPIFQQMQGFFGMSQGAIAAAKNG